MRTCCQAKRRLIANSSRQIKIFSIFKFFRMKTQRIFFFSGNKLSGFILSDFFAIKFLMFFRTCSQYWGLKIDGECRKKLFFKGLFDKNPSKKIVNATKNEKSAFSCNEYSNRKQFGSSVLDEKTLKRTEMFKMGKKVEFLIFIAEKYRKDVRPHPSFTLW